MAFTAIAILTTVKDFLHHALMFLFLRHKAVLLLWQLSQ